MFLSFFRPCIFAFKVSKRHVQRSVTEADAESFLTQGHTTKLPDTEYTGRSKRELQW